MLRCLTRRPGGHVPGLGVGPGNAESTGEIHYPPSACAVLSRLGERLGQSLTVTCALFHAHVGHFFAPRRDSTAQHLPPALLVCAFSFSPRKGSSSVIRDCIRAFPLHLQRLPSAFSRLRFHTRRGSSRRVELSLTTTFGDFPPKLGKFRHSGDVLQRIALTCDGAHGLHFLTAEGFSSHSRLHSRIFTPTLGIFFHSGNFCSAPPPIFYDASGDQFLTR